jgi:DNA-binding transcriptional ArsR family regulator
MDKKRARLEKAIGLLKLLSHPVRLSILCNLLHKGEMNVNGIVAAEGGAAGQSQISQFLGKMRREGLVSRRKEAQTVFYKIKSAEARKVVRTLYRIYCGRS